MLVKGWTSTCSLLRMTTRTMQVSFNKDYLHQSHLMYPHIWHGGWKVGDTFVTRVSVETGALLVYSCLITYKRSSQRYQVNMMIYKGLIVNKTSSSYRLNACSLNVSQGNYLKTVKDTQNLRPRYRKPPRRGFQIISYMFNLNVK